MNSRFRSQPPSMPPRQTMDGIINAPSRPGLGGRPFGRRPLLSGDELRTTARQVGDFKKPEGYHVNSATQPSVAGGLGRRRPLDAQPSLQAILPGGRRRSQATGPKTQKKQKWPRIRKWSLRGGLVMLAVLILLGGFLFTKGFFKVNKVFKGGGSAAALENNVNPSRLKGEGDGRVNILLLGRGGEGHDGADLTDTILIASIDPVNKKAALLSIPRDLWVSNGRGSSKINAVYATAKNNSLSSNPQDKAKAEAAGIQAIEASVKEVLGIPIHYYGMIDFAAFRQAVDTVGGVDMNVPPELAVKEKMWDPTTGKNYYLDVPAGQQHFDGTRALFFTRSRHTSARGDFDRSERQRLFIAALSQKILSAGTYTNPLKISQLMDAFGDHVSTDLSVNDAMRLVSIGKGIGSNFESIDMVGPPNNLLETGMISGQSIVEPTAGVGEYGDIQAFIRRALPDGYIVKEHAKVTILNGTAMAGLAGQKAEELKTYGYNVGTVGDAPTQAYDKTVIVDLSKGKKPYTKNYLEKRFGVKATTKLPDQSIKPDDGASFVIILGHNETLNR